MDASQYKDYVLVLLFIKYVSDKYANQPYAPIAIPPGASFKDMVALKGKPDIGDQINRKIVGPIATAAHLSEIPDFDDANKLGTGKEMVDRLTNLIAIFENKSLDFSRNRADGDATPVNTSCATSPPKAAKAKASSTPPPKSPASSPKSSASTTSPQPPPPPSTTPPAAPAPSSSKSLTKPFPPSPSTVRKRTPPPPASPA